MLYPTPIAKLIESFTKLPGIGIKTATRLAFYTIGMSDEDVNDFAKNLLAAKRELTYCSVCGRLTDDDPCIICTDDDPVIKVLEFQALFHFTSNFLCCYNIENKSLMIMIYTMTINFKS